MVLLSSDCSGDVYFAKDEFVIVVGVLKLKVRCVVVVLLLFRL